MLQDIRGTDSYRDAEAAYRALRRPGTGQIGDAHEVNVPPDGQQAVFTGIIMDSLETTPSGRICRIDIASGDVRILTSGPNTDRLPKYSPGGRQVAFLSDRLMRGHFQLYLLDPEDGAVRPTPPVEGWVEYLHWSPDGSRILLGVAGYGADVAGAHGAVASRRIEGEMPSWMPAVETGAGGYRWRSAWIYDLATDSVRQVNRLSINIWEAVWCGNDLLVALLSGDPREGFWYSASLHAMDVVTGNSRALYAPQQQLGWLAGAPSGKHVAVVEAPCSDRSIVAGELLLVETADGTIRPLGTCGVDVTYVQWISDGGLLLTGHRGPETVVGRFDVGTNTFIECWASRDITSGGRYASACGINDTGHCVLIGEGFERAPEIAMIRDGQYVAVKSFDLGYANQIKALKSAEPLAWKAPDGLEIQGWLLRPVGDSPHPTIMNIHGGPVWHWRPMWLGRSRDVPLLLLLQRGYAVFLPNPRGSSGRGADYVRPVYGDVGGADACDLLAGIQTLVDQGVADPRRLGIMGGSYGGFMTSWLITQDGRFSAAVPIAPHTNHVSEHLLSNIPHFIELFLGGRFNDPNGPYFERSPVMHAHKASTPTLSICGALDRCTPPEEAMQFHNALLENGVESVLVTYPEEGHGVQNFPAAIDYAARIVAWFDDNLTP